ncbi:cell division protein FtsI [Leptolyngbya sp. 'hensonii']|uniref:peptidoglycan D,D-transpeptidase FtsI family protein n=1 Tax=Leptolyngbya sp. 'hensonii' TaxID=1922337 RepID=UPI0009500E87|nr:penicillin-binding protein 2 [Leptolyngbya sp. 'hensonii']OLP17318.1 cell division protein FtsI [Leptolyngbya sp. 'hensonii']
MSFPRPPVSPGKPRRLSVVSQPPAKGSRPPAPFLIKASSNRLALVWGILLLSTLGLGCNLFRLQVLQAPLLLQQARQQQIVALRPFVPRRQIVDRRGNVLAFDQPVYTLYAHPRLFKQPKSELADQLAPILGKRPADLMTQFNQGPTGVQIEFSLPEGAAQQIEAMELDGLELIRRQQRIYPQQNLASSVLGYVNLDRQGQAGVEYSQQSFLERVVKVLHLTRTGSGSLIPNQERTVPLQVDEQRLQLTLDLRLQRVARSSLQKQLKQYQAKRGAVIVMDAMDGSILSLVVEPSYDPNEYSRFNLELFKNWAVTDLYEPGSTFKPLNVAIALESKAIQADDVFNDEGRIFVGGWPIEDYDYSSVGARGPLTVTEILQNSSNVGMVRIVQQMKRESYYRWLERLGLGQKSGIDLPFEIASQLKPREQFIASPIESATTAFGQGFSITPIQLVQMHATLANGGKRVTPHVVRGLIDASNQLQEQPDRAGSKRVFSSRTTRTVLAMMEAVVERGTGKPGRIAGYRIAGKTGTAQKANSAGGYSSHAKITSFVSIFPVEAPRYVVLAVVDEPKGDNAFGATVAAPIVKSVIETLIPLEGVAPAKVGSSTR